MRVKNLCESVKTDLSINFFIYVDQHFMHCNVWCDKNLCGINLCDRCLTRIIHINKTRAEKCHITVPCLLNWSHFLNYSQSKIREGNPRKLEPLPKYPPCLSLSMRDLPLSPSKRPPFGMLPSIEGEAAQTEEEPEAVQRPEEDCANSLSSTILEC